MYKCPVKVNTNDYNNPEISDIKRNIIYMESYILKRFGILINASIIEINTNYKSDIQFDDNFDIFKGAYVLLQKRLKHLSVIYPHSLSKLIFVIKNQRIHMTPICIILGPFEVNIWMCFIIFWLIGSILLTISGTLNLENNVFLLWAIINGITHNHFHKLEANKRKIVIWFLILGIVFPSTFTALSFNLMKKEYFKPLPMNFDDIVESNHDTIVYDAPLIPILLELVPAFRNKNESFKLRYVDSMSLEIRKSQGNFVGAGASIFFNYITEEQRELYHVISSGLPTTYICFYAAKYSFLIPKLSQITQQLLENGFLAYFENFSEKRSRRNPHKIPKPISLNEIQFSFYVLGTLNLLALLVFLWEVLYHKIRK